MQKRKSALIITDSAFVKAMFESWVDSEKIEIITTSRRAFHKMEMQALEKFDSILLDSNRPSDLARYQTLLQKFPKITVLGNYDFPAEIATKDYSVTYKLKSSSMREILKSI